MRTSTGPNRIELSRRFQAIAWAEFNLSVIIDIEIDTRHYRFCYRTVELDGLKLMLGESGRGTDQTSLTDDSWGLQEIERVRI